MAIQDNGTRNQYTATASQTVFAYTFEIFAEGDITVEQNGAVITAYTVSGVNNDSGGNITLTAGATAGDIITIYRSMDLERLTDYQQNGEFLSSEINDDFDRVWAALQQSNTNTGAAIRALSSDSILNSTNTTLAIPSVRAGKALGFTSTGELGYLSGSMPVGTLRNYATMTALIADVATTVIGDRVFLDEREAGRGGGAWWEVVDATTVTEDEYSIVSGDATRAFQIIVDRNLSDAAFGAIYDAVSGGADGTDTTAAIQAALDYMSGKGYWLMTSAGTASIDAATNINIPSNTHLAFLPTSEWRAIANDLTSYIVCDIRDVQNVYIYNPRITGDKDLHTDLGGEQGHCLNFSETQAGDTSNIHIYNPICNDSWGDGIVIRKGSDLHFYDAVCDNNRRNGITINKAIDVHFHGKTFISNTNGIAPEAGLDIEPNDATGDLKGIVFDNLITRNNTGPGCTLNLGDFPTGGRYKDVSIVIHRHEDIGSIYGLNVEKCGLGALTTPVTFTDSGDLVNLTAHSYQNGDIVNFDSITTTTGISINTDYYVISDATNSFQLSLTKGGSAITLTTDGSGEIDATVRGHIILGEQIYTKNQSCGVYFNDYSGSNNPVIYMDNLSIYDCNTNNSSSSLFGAGFGIDRKSGSGLTNTIGNCIIRNLVIEDSRTTNYMTRGISGQDNDSSGADLENFKIINPISISGYDAAGDACQVSFNGMQIEDKYGQLSRALVGSLTITSRQYSKLTTSNASKFTVTDGITKDNAGSPLELFSTNTGGIRFTPEASRQVYPLSTVAGKYVESTSVGARLKIEYSSTDDTWYVLEQQGTWSVEP